MKAREIARFGILTAMALVLGYLERLLPIAPGLPGVKLGVANTVLLYALYLMGNKQTALLLILKVSLSGLLFGGPTALLYSFAGGILSLAGMMLVKKITSLSVMGVSICGATLHNVGQILAASLVVGPVPAFSYLPILVLSAIMTGMLTGLIARLVFRALDAAGLNQLENK
ncbi:MAG: Gx transporter family protein [Candidatus Pelethousia sp.]|nr:Gx transporter family protein [Candidatus Pelethousia sp.]